VHGVLRAAPLAGEWGAALAKVGASLAAGLGAAALGLALGSIT
jgi:hypothetical protein